jgi:hypothetical protein
MNIDIFPRIRVYGGGFEDMAGGVVSTFISIAVTLQN